MTNEIKSQSSGVVLPEREKESAAWGYDMGGNYDEGHAVGWNEALDEVGRLNSFPGSAALTAPAPGECVAVPRDVLADLVSLDREKRISAERHLYALLAQQEQQP